MASRVRRGNDLHKSTCEIVGCAADGSNLTMITEISNILSLRMAIYMPYLHEISQCSFVLVNINFVIAAFLPGTTIHSAVASGRYSGMISHWRSMTVISRKTNVGVMSRRYLFTVIIILVCVGKHICVCISV